MPGKPSPALSLLLGPDAVGLLNAAVSEYGATVTDVCVADAHVAPTGGVRVRYVGNVRRADGTVRNEVLVACSGDRIPEGAAVLAGEFAGAPIEVGVWRWPHDPALPGLAAACDPLWLAELLTSAGVPVVSAPRVRVRAYRPGQRAVLEIFDGVSRWFVKVIAPRAVSDLRMRHALVGRVLPVPPIIASSTSGVVVLAEAHGTVLQQLVVGRWPDGATLPPPSALQTVLDTLPDELMNLPARPGHLQRIEQSVRVLQMTARSSPALGNALLTSVSALADELRSATVESAGPAVPAHGDFHHGQLLVDDGRICGVIDIDTAGPGDRADEWATLLGHLSVVGLTSPRAEGYVEAVLGHAERHVDRGSLRLRTAAVVLGLATGPFRTQADDWAQRCMARLDLAHHWVHSVADRSSAPVGLCGAARR